ncbi:unnamed protein product [Symbiodinium pilosum]|uniref:EF-hand domain-containing protein n=1 Tax=Symbiodinium pilosum TaxID=2952 RepID=A0A812IU70_SYMPI|nr:unnamed protein product [Symbiodinium pilosum]
MRAVLCLCLLASTGALQGADEASAKALFTRLDTNNDGSVDQEELLAWMMQQDPEMAHEDAEEEASSAFEAFDEDKNQKMSQAEFAEAVQTMEGLNERDKNDDEEENDVETAEEH